MKNFKRVLAALLAAVMLFTAVPFVASAEDDTPWLQLESSTVDGKSTLTIKLNVDKIKTGKISGLKIDDILGVLFGSKEVANSGIVNINDLLQIFPIVYEVDDTGAATTSTSSVLDVVGATAIIGLTTILNDYIDDPATFLSGMVDDLKDEISMSSIASDAALRKPNKLTDYIISLVKTFHAYYNAVRVNNPDDPELTNQRLGLVTATKITLKNALCLIGVSAPDSM